MAKKEHHARSFTVPLATVAGLVAGLSSTIQRAQTQDFGATAREFGRVMTGFDSQDGSWDFGRLKFGLLPILVGVSISMLASKFGLNRRIARTGLPVIRV
jgi:hypothetical protein